MKTAYIGGLFAVLAAPASALTANWIDWTSGVTENGVFTAQGTITSGSETIDVTYTNPQGVAFIQTGSGIDYFSGGGTGTPNPFVSEGPNGNDNAPPGAEMIALRFAGTQTLTFSQPVQNLFYAYVSMNGNGYAYDQEFEILSNTGSDYDGAGTDGRGYWGSGPVVKVDNLDGTYSLNADGPGEPHGVIFFEDKFTSLTWTSLTSENWNGFTIGIQGTDDQVPDDPVVPLPAGGVLMLGALGGLAAVRRRR